MNCENPTDCIWPTCDGQLILHGEERVVLDFDQNKKKFKRGIRVFRICTECRTLFYHVHELPTCMW